MKINEPVHKMLVLISCVNTCSERSDELARPRTCTVSSGDSLLAYILVRTLMMIQAKVKTSRPT